MRLEGRHDGDANLNGINFAPGLAVRGKAQATLDLEAAIVEIVEERAPITVRGVAYALFVRGLLASMAVSETRRVSRVTTDMRANGSLDWTQSVDDSRSSGTSAALINARPDCFISRAAGASELTSQHPDFPFSALSDIRCSPEARDFDGISARALVGEPELAHPERCVGSQGPSLIDVNL